MPDDPPRFARRQVGELAAREGSFDPREVRALAEEAERLGERLYLQVNLLGSGTLFYNHNVPDE